MIGLVCVVRWRGGNTVSYFYFHKTVSTCRNFILCVFSVYCYSVSPFGGLAGRELRQSSLPLVPSVYAHVLTQAV